MSVAEALADEEHAPRRKRRRTLWIVGTSMSIECGGYVDTLVTLADRSDLDVVNLSVGDQTSVMGCMRVFAERARFCAGDVVIWEYSLLDHLLGDGPFSADDAIQARRMAWATLQSSGLGIVALLCAPREHPSTRTQAEQLTALDAEDIGIACIDLRDLFIDARIDQPRDHYRDDRHLSITSPLIPLLAERVLQAALMALTKGPGGTSSLPLPAWRWIDLGGAAGLALPANTYSNSLMEVQASVLGVGEHLALPVTRRVVALGVVSTAESGAIWCGHPECPPAATRMPDELQYPFLLRATGIPCVRAQLTMLVSAPDWAFRNGVWRAYGHALSDMPGTVAVFGVLVEAN